MLFISLAKSLWTSVQKYWKLTILKDVKLIVFFAYPLNFDSGTNLVYQFESGFLSMWLKGNYSPWYRRFCPPWQQLYLCRLGADLEAFLRLGELTEHSGEEGGEITRLPNSQTLKKFYQELRVKSIFSYSQQCTVNFNSKDKKEVLNWSKSNYFFRMNMTPRKMPWIHDSPQRSLQLTGKKVEKIWKYNKNEN